MITLQTISIFLEIIIVFMALGLALAKKQLAGYGLAITFGIYVFYDAVKLYNYTANNQILQIFFFIATLSAFLSLLLMLTAKK